MLLAPSARQKQKRSCGSPFLSVGCSQKRDEELVLACVCWLMPTRAGLTTPATSNDGPNESRGGRRPTKAASAAARRKAGRLASSPACLWRGSKDPRPRSPPDEGLRGGRVG